MIIPQRGLSLSECHTYRIHTHVNQRHTCLQMVSDATDYTQTGLSVHHIPRKRLIKSVRHAHAAHPGSISSYGRLHRRIYTHSPSAAELTLLSHPVDGILEGAELIDESDFALSVRPTHDPRLWCVPSTPAYCVRKTPAL